MSDALDKNKKPKRTRKPQIKISVRDISEFNLLENNPREHSEENLALIESSIKRNKAGRSILLDENDDALAGNGTLQAARRAGVKKVIVVEASGDELVAVKRTDLSPEQKSEMVILDNRTNETSEWNLPELQKSLVALKEAGRDVSALGWRENDLSLFFESDWTPKEIKSDEDAGLDKLKEVLKTSLHYSQAEFEPIVALAKLLEKSEKETVLLAVRAMLEQEGAKK